MREHSVFLIITFIVIICIVLVSDSLMSAVMIVALLTNLFVIRGHIHKICDQREGMDGGSADGRLNGPTADANFDGGSLANIKRPTLPDQNLPSNNTNETDNPALQSMLARDNMVKDFDLWDKYREDDYKAAQKYRIMPDEMVNTMDSASTIMARRRNRDKASIDARINHDKNFYKYYFDDELDIEERKQWWGNNEF